MLILKTSHRSESNTGFVVCVHRTLYITSKGRMEARLADNSKRTLLKTPGSVRRCRKPNKAFTVTEIPFNIF
jgi:hypothetical protein